jgi:tricorn protease-like protein
MKIYNVTIDMKAQDKNAENFQKVFPNGFYKFSVNIYDEDDDNIFELTYEAVKRNPRRT